MEIFDKIKDLNFLVADTDKLVDEFLSSLQDQKSIVKNCENKISTLKEEIQNNIDDIDKILEDYNANS